MSWKNKDTVLLKQRIEQTEKSASSGEPTLRMGSSRAEVNVEHMQGESALYCVPHLSAREQELETKTEKDLQLACGHLGGNCKASGLWLRPNFSGKGRE